MWTKKAASGEVEAVVADVVEEEDEVDEEKAVEIVGVGAAAWR